MIKRHGYTYKHIISVLYITVNVQSLADLVFGYVCRLNHIAGYSGDTGI